MATFVETKALEWLYPNLAQSSMTPDDLGEKMHNLFINIFIKFFFLLTPFFLLSTFLSMTRAMEIPEKKKLAVKVTFSVIIICIILFLTGDVIFSLFGITLNSFRIGTGILLMLSAIALVQGTDKIPTKDSNEDISVVPLAIPVTVGPATTGALLVMGVELQRMWERVIGISALCLAIMGIGVLLYLSGEIEKLIKKQGLTIMCKITGLVLAALSAQMIMSGVLGFLGKS
jgi:multiple antibiotic resistance protein